MRSVCRLVRVVNRSTQVVQVAGQLQCVEDPITSRASHVSPLALVVSEDKEFILADRATQCAAKLVPISAGYASGGLSEGIAGKIGV